MQTAEVVLSVLRERGRKGQPLTQLYRQLFNGCVFLRGVLFRGVSVMR